MSESNAIQRDVHGVAIELVVGDITRQDDIEAVVNAANAQLRTGGGVAGAIHGAAGPGLAEEAGAFAPIGPGEAIVTSGHALPNRWVIHTLGPVYGQDDPADQYLTDCYRHSLDLAEEKGIRSIAFPAISTGAFGYPMEAAAEVALATVLEKAEHLDAVSTIRFVLYDEAALELHARVLERLLDRRNA